MGFGRRQESLVIVCNRNRRYRRQRSGTTVPLQTDEHSRYDSTALLRDGTTSTLL